MNSNLFLDGHNLLDGPPEPVVAEAPPTRLTASRLGFPTVAMKLTGHRTRSVFQRDVIVGETMRLQARAPS